MSRKFGPSGATGHRPFKRLERRLAPGRPPVTTARDSARMSLVRQRDTAPELAVRRVAAALGLRLTRANRDLPGSPDLANRTRRIVVFVHGCFWHRHPGCPRTTTPKRNRPFWLAKFQRNVERDRDACNALRRLGFRVVIVWECESERVGTVRTKLVKAVAEFGPLTRRHRA